MLFNVYIDGYNLYYGMREAARREPYYKRCYWLDLFKLGKWLESLYPQQWKLNEVKYFTAQDISPSYSPGAKRSNQARYWDALRAKQVKIIEGFFRDEEKQCKHGPCDKRGIYTDRTEKMTDVALGVHMVSDALRNEVQAVVLITRDMDQVPPLKMLETHCPRVLRCIAFPPRKADYPVGLMKVATAKRAHPAFGKTDPEQAGKILIDNCSTLCLGLPVTVLEKQRLPLKFWSSPGGARTTQEISEPEDWAISESLRKQGPSIKFLDARLKEEPN